MIDVCETRDVGLLRGLLERDRVGGAYLLGDLEAPFFDQGTWIVAREGGQPAALGLAFRAFADPVVLTFGSTEGVRAIVGALASSEPPIVRTSGVVYLKIPPEHEAACTAAFEIVERDVMKVMWLAASVGRPEPRRGVTASGRTAHTVRRLGPGFPLDRILEVYRSYPGHFFEPGQLDYGIYYGGFEGDRLVAVAGTHVYSPAGRVAAVGNIVTSTDARGRGHAAACTGAVIDELHARGCDTIVLHVAANNAPALACYRGLGFREYGPVLQCRAALRR